VFVEEQEVGVGGRYVGWQEEFPCMCYVMKYSCLCHVCVYKSTTCVLNYHSLLARAKLLVLNCNFKVATTEWRYNSPAC
jgi:hypothetical protein